MDFVRTLSDVFPAAEGRLGVGSAGPDMVTGDVYAVTPHQYAGTPLNEVSCEPIGRVSVDFATGTAYLWPDEVFTGS